LIELNLSDILERTSDLTEKKVWYVAIIWRPNVWKSTFVNALIWEKISITTDVPQTTRKKVLAIYNDDDSQIVFFDTPWIHQSNKKFNEEINLQAINTLNEADLVLYFIDSTREWWEEENYIKTLIWQLKKPIIKVYTKLDLESKLIPKKDSIKISSKTKEWFDELLTKIKEYLKVWVSFFGDDIYTKQDLNFRVSEIIREKVFLNSKEELPHSIYIWVEEIEESTTTWEKKEDLLKIIAYIYTETDSQKYILIWKWWLLVSKIWKEARIELEKIFWKKVFLALRVKVKKWWKKDERLIKEMLG
jgi:GTP-binding protein Era